MAFPASHDALGSSYSYSRTDPQISHSFASCSYIKSFRVFRGSDAPNNARRIMKHGDVLISTRRPTRGAVVAIPQEFDGHICTVFFTTLTITDWNVLDPFYLALFLRTSIGRMQFQAHITETAYPVITDADVEDMTILYPDIDEQHRITKQYNNAVKDFHDTLNEAYRHIAKARQFVEDFVLGHHAETIPVKQFALETHTEEDHDE